jgi:hypothetical protein
VPVVLAFGESVVKLSGCVFLVCAIHAYTHACSRAWAVANAVAAACVLLRCSGQPTKLAVLCWMKCC